MAVLDWIVNNILTQASIIIALIAFLGLVLQKKPANEVFAGTMKTLFGFMIDHTNLNPAATEDDLRKLCSEAVQYGFHSVAINPCWTRLAARELAGTDVVVDPCIGFPLGAGTTEAKAEETKIAVTDGAGEIDMCIRKALQEGYPLTKDVA